MIPLMLTPSLRDSIVAHLRPAYAGRTVGEASYAVVYELGLMGLREYTAIDREVQELAKAIATGNPF
jgi:hypothetical protein